MRQGETPEHVASNLQGRLLRPMVPLDPHWCPPLTVVPYGEDGSQEGSCIIAFLAVVKVDLNLEVHHPRW